MTGSPTGRSERRKLELIALGRQVLVDDGLDAFVMRRIAEKAGIRVGNLQYYFPTRDDLLEAVMRAEFDQDVDALRSSDGDPEERLIGALHVLLAGWSDHGGGDVFAPLFLLSMHHERFTLLRREIYQRFYAELAPIVRAIDPGVSSAEAATRSVLITALVDGVSFQVGVVSPAVRRRVLARMSREAVGIARGS